MTNDVHVPRVHFGLSWLIVVPAGLWAIVDYYLPVMAGTLDPLQSGVVAAAGILLITLSLAGHVVAHYWVARWLREPSPPRIWILAFGDAAEGWPMAAAGRDAAIAAAGPLLNLLFAAAAYTLWNAQISDLVGDTAILVAGFNAWLFLINLLPAFPLDGGRLTRGLLEGGDAASVAIKRLPRLLGFAIVGATVAWATFLLAQNARFSRESFAITLLFGLILADGLRTRSTVKSQPAIESVRTNGSSILGRVGAVVLAAALLLPPGSLLLVNNGLDAPGVALPTGPMVNVAPAERHPQAGSFFLVTVISQAPITAGAWLLGQVDPAIQIVPPQFVTPRNTTPQQQAAEGYQMLDNSEKTAMAVGLRLAGYPQDTVGKGAQVLSILPGSHASGLLRDGDVITSMNGIAVHSAADLISAVSRLSSAGSVHLQVKRGATQLAIDVPLMPPAALTDPPRIGIAVQDAGFDFKPPFPISIVTEKIDGGPSAGLMFTLTVYNDLTPGDLTGGRKIAGTGTISLDGSVGPIGGVKQKVFAAEGVGASYFLCPVENYADAVSVARNIQVVKIATAAQAIDFLRSLPPAR
jgi:PDZ domain-containing protein